MTSEIDKNYVRKVVENIFNSWTALRLAVEHGMGGKHGQTTAIECMNYVYQYCVQNSQVTQEELHELLENIMDQEFDTLCEDNSISEISLHIIKFIQLINEKQYEVIEHQLSKLPPKAIWLQHDIKLNLISSGDVGSSSSDSGSESEMHVVPSQENGSSNDHFGWMTVTRK